MTKCTLCKEKIQTTFLNKIQGTFIGPKKNRKTVCSQCQKKYKEKLMQEF